MRLIKQLTHSALTRIKLPFTNCFFIFSIHSRCLVEPKRFQLLKLLTYIEMEIQVHNKLSPLTMHNKNDVERLTSQTSFRL